MKIPAGLLGGAAVTKVKPKKKAPPDDESKETKPDDEGMEKAMADHFSQIATGAKPKAKKMTMKVKY